MTRGTLVWRLCAVVVVIIAARRSVPAVVASGARWWRERIPEPAVCAQMIRDVEGMRAILHEGLELLRSAAPQEKLEDITAREEDASVSFVGAWQLHGHSWHEGTRHEIEEGLKSLKLEKVEFHDAQVAYFEQQER